jgi:hypothetical protein
VATRMSDERAPEVAALLRRAIDAIEDALTQRNAAAAAGTHPPPLASSGGRQPKNSGR